MKSRTFSQISASERGRRVPSGEYEQMRSWMRSASGSRASRVCMGLLVDRTESLAGTGKRFANAGWRGASQNVVNCKHVVQRHEGVEVLCEMGIQLLQLRELQVLQFALLVESQTHSFADQFMRNPKRDAFADQIRGTRKRVHVAGFCCFLHARKIELDRPHPARDQRN